MNIEYANTIPLRLVFDKIGSQPFEQDEKYLFYQSPFRKDDMPSIRVNVRHNTWRDNVDHKRGNVITLVCLYLKSIGKAARTKHALEWLRNTIGYVILNCPPIVEAQSDSDRKYRYQDHGMITRPELIRYLEGRGIPLKYARFVLKEIKLINTETQKTFSALGMVNDDGGISVRNPVVKAQIRSAYVTFIRGQVIKPDGVHVFKDFMDYLSMITRRNGKPFDDDVIILNHLSNMRLSSAYIRGYGYSSLYTWMDNDQTGLMANCNYAAFCKTEPCLKHIPMNRHYLGYKDVNEWHKSEAAWSPHVFLHEMPFKRLNEDSTR